MGCVAVDSDANRDPRRMTSPYAFARNERACHPIRLRIRGYLCPQQFHNRLPTLSLKSLIYDRHLG